MSRRTWSGRWRGWTRRSRTGPRSPVPGSAWGRRCWRRPSAGCADRWPPPRWAGRSGAGCAWPPWTASYWTCRITRPTGSSLAGGATRAGRRPGFPQVRVVTLAETGTHASIDVRIGGFNGGERELAVQMASSAAGMLVIMDRNFPGVELWKAYTRAGAHLLLRARSTVASRPLEVLADGSYLGRMSLGGQRASHPGGVTVRVVEYRIDGGELIRLLTDLLDVDAYPAAELAALYHDRWEAESAYRQVKTFQRGPAQVLRSATPALVHQEVWAHLVVHHCLNGIIMRVADGERIDPHQISFVKALKHVRRSVIRQTKDAVSAVGAFLAMLEAKVRRKLDTGPRRSRSAPRVLKRPDSKYSPSVKKQQHGPTRRVPQKVITLSPAMLQ
ncbi:IS4 family transposase [Streptomyces alboflavus]|uniref:IS4 family transposase n=1 Tax=Streptomyces alboflavus TaxID=67267 RepID=UPI00368A22F3